MNVAYYNLIRDAGQAAITHLGLVDETGTELTGGSYARLPVTWVDDGDGVSRPDGNLLFNVPAGIVAGWRGYSALAAGTDYGGEDLTQETYAAPGQYNLLAAQTSISHAAAA